MGTGMFAGLFGPNPPSPTAIAPDPSAVMTAQTAQAAAMNTLNAQNVTNVTNATTAQIFGGTTATPLSSSSFSSGLGTTPYPGGDVDARYLRQELEEAYQRIDQMKVEIMRQKLIIEFLEESF